MSLKLWSDHVDLANQSVTRTGGDYSTSERPILFTASTLSDCGHMFDKLEKRGDDIWTNDADLTRYILVAVTDLKSDEAVERLGRLFSTGLKILIDSGIFVLTNDHKRNHGCTMDEALALSPKEIDGFDQLLERYLNVVSLYGDRSWGYIEMDQGGRDNKIKTREMLESHGLRPIPVYHPINDGWDYFDYLAKRYNRICIGNIVQAKPELRTRIMATVCERKLDYPNLWMHALGVSRTSILFSLPFDSADASKWLEPTRWPKFGTFGCMKRVGEIENRHYYYNRSEEPDSPRGRNNLVSILAWDTVCSGVTWRHHRERIGQEIKLKYT